MFDLNGLLTQIEQGLNALLALDPALQQKLDPLAGTSLCVTLAATSLRFAVQFNSTNIECMTDPFIPSPATVSLTGTPNAFLQLLITQNLNKSLHENIELAGDVEIANHILEFITQLDIDWTEAIAKHTGDPIARQLQRAVLALKANLQPVKRKGTQMVIDYLQEEARCLPTKIEVANFIAEVDELRLRLDRLLARFEKLAHENP